MRTSNFHDPIRHLDITDGRCECIGRIVVGESGGVRFFFCGRCDAYSDTLDDFPAMTDRSVNQNCWEGGDDRSLDPLS